MCTSSDVITALLGYHWTAIAVRDGHTRSLNPEVVGSSPHASISTEYTKAYTKAPLQLSSEWRGRSQATSELPSRDQRLGVV